MTILYDIIELGNYESNDSFFMCIFCQSVKSLHSNHEFNALKCIYVYCKLQSRRRSQNNADWNAKVILNQEALEIAND